ELQAHLDRGRGLRPGTGRQGPGRDRRAAPPAMTMPRTGIGYDIHRLVPDRRLGVRGVRIYHPTGLAGHSDGDVLAHAIADALLGATALGDLGTHFPSDDPAFASADSIGLLERVVTLVRSAGYRIGSVDASVIAQAPRLQPHLAGMRDRLSRAAGVGDPGGGGGAGA